MMPIIFHSPSTSTRPSPAKSEIESIARSHGLNIQRMAYLVLPQSETHLRSISIASHSPIGIWGNCRPLIDETGDPYIEPPDSNIAHDFKLWAIPENQEYAISTGPFVNAGGFTMAISALTPEDILDSLYRCDVGDQQYEIDKCMKCVDSMIDILGWACIPIESFHECMVLMSNRSNHGLIEDVYRKYILKHDLHARMQAMRIR